MRNAISTNAPVGQQAGVMDLDKISIEKVKLWSPEALKYFLSVRKLSVDGTFDELVARVFAASEMAVAVDAAAETAEQRLFHEYTAKLSEGGEVYPDPTTFDDGWIGEDQGRFQWPSIYIFDIQEYLSKTAAVSDISLKHQLLNEYKAGKAYRYYTCEWVKEIKMHPVRPTSVCCFLKADVYPSMSIKKKPYKVWVLVTKKTKDSEGGEIKTAYCTCTAGMLGSCNHIAGLLFRVECAVISGATKQSCTEASCEWVVPKKGVSRKPQKWSESYVVKEKYGQKVPTQKKVRNITNRRKFQPFHDQYADRLIDNETICKDMENMCSEHAPESVFYLTRQKKKAPKPHVPENLVALAAGCSDLQELLTAVSHIKSVDITAVQAGTLGQADSDEWRRQRCGRITSSDFYVVYTKTETLLAEVKKFGEEKSSSVSLTDKLLGRSSVPKTVAMKYGLAMEPKAKQAYAELEKAQHKKWSATDSGLVVSDTHPYLATSPDLLVFCDCHGKRLCEVKCPFSVSDQKPTVANIDFLSEADNGVIRLKKKHPYYGQIQGQLALSKCAECDLFIFTKHGTLTVVVQFDNEFWESMLQNLEWFWTRKVAPELLRDANIANTSNTTEVMEAVTRKRTAEHDDRMAEVPPKQKLPLSKGKRKKSATTVTQVYRCGKCYESIQEYPKTFFDSSIKCDKCPEWYHQVCVNIAEEPPEDFDFVCFKCAPGPSSTL